METMIFFICKILRRYTYEESFENNNDINKEDFYMSFKSFSTAHGAPPKSTDDKKAPSPEVAAGGGETKVPETKPAPNGREPQRP